MSFGHGGYEDMCSEPRPQSSSPPPPQEVGHPARQPSSFEEPGNGEDDRHHRRRFPLDRGRVHWRGHAGDRTPATSARNIRRTTAASPGRTSRAHPSTVDSQNGWIWADTQCRCRTPVRTLWILSDRADGAHVPGVWRRIRHRGDARGRKESGRASRVEAMTDALLRGPSGRRSGPYMSGHPSATIIASSTDSIVPIELASAR